MMSRKTPETLGDILQAGETTTGPGGTGNGLDATSKTIVCHFKPLIKYINANAKNPKIGINEEIVDMRNLLQWFPDEEIAREGYDVVHWFYKRGKKRKGNRTMGTHPLIVGGQLQFLNADKKHVIGGKHHDDYEDLIENIHEMDKFFTNGKVNGYHVPQEARDLVENHTNFFSTIYEAFTEKIAGEQLSLKLIESTLEEMKQSLNATKLQYGVDTLRTELFNKWYSSKKTTDEERSQEAYDAFHGTIDRYNLYIDHFKWTDKNDWKVKGSDANENSGDDRHLIGENSYMKVRRGNKSIPLTDTAIEYFDELDDMTKFFFMSVLERTTNKFANPDYVDLASLNPANHDIPKYRKMIEDIREDTQKKLSFLNDYKKNEATTYLGTISIPERPSIIPMKR